MTSIALFGTSADPPTAGHQSILAWLSDQFDEVAVWASDNPFKSHQTPLEHRAAMLQLLIEDIYPPRHNIHLRPEMSSPRSLITVERAKQQWPESTLTLVIGADLVAQLPQWYRVEDLLQQVNLLIVPRSGYPLTNSDLQPLQQQGATVEIANLSVPAVSSTAYREEGDSEIVTPPVEAYIHREQLYECQDAPKKSWLIQRRNAS
ncbi:nicotinate-nucleotide adenylyltransferase [Thermocoleostomius sinensis]|uniref:nicotinate-nucleotide adenylyltransferase n=1 Tax=Thermocoleostomius sinensis A174 TaxID=2016057 RepID=A0A9E9CAQ6_9CYAN|nr:nicotinate-nucleotide adenylyltransferase [Thermocoleostomius sinensis]WAL59240.1 nicotinate-nucleotide adenylyltransferase [Thermocoleostomius sinensis A174]